MRTWGSRLEGPSKAPPDVLAGPYADGGVTHEDASETRQMNGNGHHRDTRFTDHARTDVHGSADVALIVYLFLAAFAYVFAAMSGAI